MPAFIPHQELESAVILCQNCAGLSMYVRDIAHHWSLAKIDFTYECSDCGSEIKTTIARSNRRH
jgi:hypothetical protein